MKKSKFCFLHKHNKLITNLIVFYIVVTFTAKMFKLYKTSLSLLKVKKTKNLLLVKLKKLIKI